MAFSQDYLIHKILYLANVSQNCSKIILEHLKKNQSQKKSAKELPFSMEEFTSLKKQVAKDKTKDKITKVQKKSPRKNPVKKKSNRFDRSISLKRKWYSTLSGMASIAIVKFYSFYLSMHNYDDQVRQDLSTKLRKVIGKTSPARKPSSPFLMIEGLMILETEL